MIICDAILKKYANDILENDEVNKMEAFIQHGKVTTLKHCMAVAHISFLIAEKLKMKIDKRSLIRGALLHDFYLYDWHYNNEGGRFHGFKHPTLALKNAEKYFQLNDKERDIIKKHMWPMTIILPKYKETFVVCLADKYCALTEMFKKNDK